MSPTLRATLIHSLAPGLGIVMMAAIAQARGLSWRDDLRLVRPPPRVLAAFLVAWVAWVALAELAGRALGVAPPPTWQGRSPQEIAVLALGIVVLAPVAEELAFRGFGFHAIRRTPLGERGAVVLMAAVFALAHVQYGPVEIGMIFLDGLVLGVARARSGSLMVPMLMHSLGNLFALYQRVHG